MMYKPDKQKISTALHTEIMEITAYRNYWSITGTVGRWLAKPARDKKQFDWWCNVDQELRDRGFQAMPKTKQVGNWVLSDYIEGKICRYRDIDDLGKLIRTLAQFHKQGQQLDTPPNNQVVYLLSDRLYERLSCFYSQLTRNEVVRNQLEALLVHYGPMFYQQGYLAYYTLCNHGLEKYAREAYSSHMLTHRDLASHNWMKDVQGNIWLIDFETADYDLQVGDLWQICSRILTEHHWDLSLFQSLLEEYEQIKPLTTWEKRTLAILFSFPNEFFRECIGLLEAKPGYKLELSLPYLEQIVTDYSIWMGSVHQIKKWLK
jgi:CotS family spore coat protein